MNTTTLRGIFPEPKPPHRRNFVRENIKNLKEMQAFLQEAKITSKSQDLKVENKFKNVAPKVYSNIFSKRKSKDSEEVGYQARNPRMRTPQLSFKSRLSDRGVQTEKPEDVPKLFEKGQVKYPSPSVVVQPKKINQEQGDAAAAVTRDLRKMDIDEKQNYIKQNIKNIKANKQKLEESPNPLLPPVGYQKGALPKYLKETSKTPVPKTQEYEGESLTGLVLLPDEEKREYLRVARENYAALIKELNSMPVSNDTLRKRKRKIEIEDELKRLDEVIKIFQKPKVFVKADA